MSDSTSGDWKRIRGEETCSAATAPATEPTSTRIVGGFVFSSGGG